MTQGLWELNMKKSVDSLALFDGYSRREWLRIGGLSCAGLSLSQLLRPTSLATDVDALTTSFGRAKSCILIFLTGGPSQHETFDPKPEAPREIRGEFKSIATSVPGIHFSELLPKTAKLAQHLAVIRSMHTDVHSHATSGYWMLTGFEHASKGESEPPGPNDWPSMASAIGMMKPSKRSPFSSVVLPEPIVNNPNNPWPGQDGGFMGHAWNPYLFKCDPSAERFEIEGLNGTSGIAEARVTDRLSLLRQIDWHFARRTSSDAVASADRVQQRAFDVLQSATTRNAFELEKEPAAIRDTYGRHKFGQSVLLARRLVEAGVRLVQVNWPREPGDSNSGNPLWDTHSANANRLRTVLCPKFDQTIPALISDLQTRGMLQETLVVMIGEFGRTPKINANGGRDHWGHCFSVALAGGGIRGGQVIGSSDRDGGYPVDRPLRPSDLSATLFHLMGIDPNGTFNDRMARPRPLTLQGVPIRELAT